MLILEQGLIFLILLMEGCKLDSKPPASSVGTSKPIVVAPTITITSTAFKNGAVIPKRYSCEGENISPALVWTNVPDGAKSLALVCEDPDAPRGTFVHWVIYNIPADRRGLAENTPPRDALAGGVHQGKNGAEKVGYIGPCPPPGKPHHYEFLLYALDTKLAVSDDLTRDRLTSAMKGHIIAEGELMGTYERQQ